MLIILFTRVQDKKPGMIDMIMAKKAKPEETKPKKVKKAKAEKPNSFSDAFSGISAGSEATRSSTRQCKALNAKADDHDAAAAMIDLESNKSNTSNKRRRIS